MFARICSIATLATVLAPLASAAPASAPPVGPLPSGPVTTVSAQNGTLIAVALPGEKASSGLVWRLARKVNASVLRQVSERNIGRDVVVVYRAVGVGSVTVAYGLTKGETRKAFQSVRYSVRIR